MDNSLFNEPESSLGIFQEVSDLLKLGNIKEADQVLQSSIGTVSQSEKIYDALKYITFWNDKFDCLDCINPKEQYKRGPFLITHWINFCNYFPNNHIIMQNELLSLKKLIFEKASYEIKKNNFNHMDADSLLNLGRCYKSLGDYQTAMKYLEKSLKLNKQNAEIMAELADAYSLNNKEKMAKTLFREAFFLDPGAIKITFLESPIITKMIEKISKNEYDRKELNYWIPVYGTIYRVFNIVRELKPIELGKLKQAIFTMESKGKLEESIEKAILLNHYFRLIDHTRISFIGHGIENRDVIEEVLEKIRNLAPQIYNEYTK